MTGRIVAWMIIVVTALELCAREAARRSIVQAAIGRTPGLASLVLVASVAALATIVATPRRGHAAILLAALFCAGVAAQLSLGARLQSDGFYYFAYLRRKPCLRVARLLVRVSPHSPIRSRGNRRRGRRDRDGRIVHVVVLREGTEHDPRHVHGSGRRLRVAVGGIAREAHTRAVGAA